MNIFAPMGVRMSTIRGARWAKLGLMAVVLGFAGVAAQAQEGELAKEELACLSCHDKPNINKKLENGEVLSLRISTKAYSASAHNETTCEDCHSGLDAKTHGKVKSSIESRREYIVEQQDVCRDCHKAKYTQYDDSVHAALVKSGSKKAPLCANCHNPHTQPLIKQMDPQTVPACATCHEAIYKASSHDVHGLERAAKGKAAPTCADCHHAHEVKAASMGEGVKDACLVCHKDAEALHRDWLPNTGRHFDAISCPACHSPDAQRRVNLRLFDGSNQQKKAEKTGVPQFLRLTDAVDTQNMGLDERALWSLLKDLSQDGAGGKTVLNGRLEVRSGVEAHQISEKSKAIKDCNFCHMQGATPFQSVTLTLAGPDGRPLRHGVQKDVLTSLTAIESVRGFYAIGSTRIKLLDILLVMVVLGAACVPIGHMTIKRLFKGIRQRLEAERKAALQEAENKSHDVSGSAADAQK